MRTRSAIVLGLLGLTLTASHAWAADPVNCAKIYTYNCRKDLSMDPAEMHECMRRGYDAPPTCRKDEGKSAGVRVGGSSGFSYGTIQSPQHAPGIMKAQATVGLKKIGRSFGYPPWPGFPCVLPGGINLCVPGGPDPNTGPTNPLCPQKDDDLFGLKQALAAVLALPCGGALPLTSYELTLNANPNRIASTEHGSYYLWTYVYNGSTYVPAAGTNPQKLPTYLCTNGRKTVDLTPPIAQMITYNVSHTSITLRLKGRETLDWRKDPPPEPPYNPDDPEKFLIIPLVGGVPQIPNNCANRDTYWKTIEHSKAEIVIESATNEGCEGTSGQCASGTPAPTPEQSCEVVNLIQSFTGECANKMQYMTLDRANLLYPPGTNVTLTTIQGRTAKLAPSTTGSRIFLQSEASIRLGTSSPPITLKEGGRLNLTDGGTVTMKGPATVNAATGQVILTGGGHIVDAGGNQTQTLANGSTYTPTNPVMPFTINVNRSLDMVPGYQIPTAPNPYVQLPVNP